MKLLHYEFRKFFTNRFLVILFIFLLVCDAGLTFYNSHEKNKENTYIDKGQFEEVFSLYISDKEAFMKEFSVVSGLKQEFETKRDYKSDEFKACSKKFSGFSTVLYHKDYIDKFDKNIDAFIKTAEKNKKDYVSVGISPDSYLYRYQDNIIDVYSKVKGVKIEFELIKGWDDYFSFSIPNLLIIVYLLVAVPSIMLAEDNAGLKQIIHITKNGRLRLYTSKYLFCIIVTAVICIFFLGIPLIATYFTTGLSSINNSVQAIEYFFVNPLPVSIGSFLLISSGIKILVFIGLGTVIMLFAILFRKLTQTFIASLAFCGVFYFLSTISYMNINNPTRVLNLFFITETDKCFARYLGINVFGQCVSHYSFIIVSYLLIILVAGIAGGFLYVKFIRKGVMNSKIRIPLKFPEKIRNSFSGLQSRMTSKNLYGYEFFKLLFANKTIFVIILFILLKVIQADYVYGGEVSYEDNIYKTYMIKLEGGMTDEKKQYIINERKEIDEILLKKSSIESQFQNGSISFDEYREYLSKYNVAELKNKVFKRVESHAAYIDKMSAEGRTAYFVYDTGWNIMFFTEFDYVLFLMFMFVFCGEFADEYRSGFDQLLKSAKKGRGRTFGAKFVSCGVTVFILTSAFIVIDIVYLIKNNMFPAAGSPLISIESFSDAVSGISIMNYTILMFTLRFVGFMLLYVFIVSLSELFRKNITVLGTVTIIALIPYMLVKFGLADAGYISLPGILSGTDYFLLSAKAGLFGDFGILAIFMTFMFIISAVLINRSYKKYCLK